VGWGDAGFEPDAAGQQSYVLPLSHHAFTNIYIYLYIFLYIYLYFYIHLESSGRTETNPGIGEPFYSRLSA
jgi:hypothetical protein